MTEGREQQKEGSKPWVREREEEEEKERIQTQEGGRRFRVRSGWYTVAGLFNPILYDMAACANDSIR